MPFEDSNFASPLDLLISHDIKIANFPTTASAQLIIDWTILISLSGQSADMIDNLLLLRMMSGFPCELILEHEIGIVLVAHQLATALHLGFVPPHPIFTEDFSEIHMAFDMLPLSEGGEVQFVSKAVDVA